MINLMSTIFLPFVLDILCGEEICTFALFTKTAQHCFANLTLFIQLIREIKVTQSTRSSCMLNKYEDLHAEKVVSVMNIKRCFCFKNQFTISY